MEQDVRESPVKEARQRGGGGGGGGGGGMVKEDEGEERGDMQVCSHLSTTYC